jgi:hypothetical protein
MWKMGVMMAKAPKPHLNPGPFKKAVASGPPIQVVAMYGEEMKANMKARFLRCEVSATKIPVAKFTPL